MAYVKDNSRAKVALLDQGRGSATPLRLRAASAVVESALQKLLLLGLETYPVGSLWVVEYPNNLNMCFVARVIRVARCPILPDQLVLYVHNVKTKRYRELYVFDSYLYPFTGEL